ncbi:PH domain-containing protein [Jatrophihabitans sp.]|uniref:PH domain-containing protein n=1 Tax=Jatrophihabitans sp. TaxID=1932789 RepID=UPI0030C65D96|nr:hypothetical protein [Jatrophihabitans sp.]
MDELTPDRRPSATFAPDRRLTLGCAVFAVLALLLAIVTSDKPGQLLAALAAGLLAAYAVTDLIFSPRLVVDAAGVRVNTPLLRRTFAWDEIEALRSDARQRMGLRSVTLEIDAGDTLVIMSRRSLGELPETVAELATAFDPRT